jgi:hypothetical protein
MDKLDLIAQYDKILGGNFFPERDNVEVQVSPETESPPANTKAPEANILETSPGDQASTRTGEQNSPNEQTHSPGPAAKLEGKPETKPEWIPQLKKVVEFSDSGGKKHLIGLENYKSTARSSKLRSRAEQQPFKEYAILLKAIVDRDGSKGTRVDFVLELQSEALRDIFRTIAKPYAELNLESNPIVIDYPFRCLFFLRGKLRELSEAADTPATTQKELGQLLDFINSPMGLKKVIEAYNKLVPYGKITFPMLWTLFPPHEMAIYSKKIEDGWTGRGYMLESVSYEEQTKTKSAYWKFHLLSGYHDGHKFCVRRYWVTQYSFDGIKNIDLRNLYLIPFSIIEEKRRNEIRAAFVERGKVYVDYCSREFNFLHYKGSATLQKRDKNRRLGDWDSDGVVEVSLSACAFHPSFPCSSSASFID